MAGITTPQTATGVATGTNTETVALTIPFSGGNSTNDSLANPISGNNCKTRISGSVNITAGTGTTAVVIRCRKNGLTGTAVGVSHTDTLAAGNTEDIPYYFDDTAPGFAQAYVITVQQTGGTAAGTVNFVEGSTQDYN